MKAAVIILGIIIVVLLGVLVFAPSAKGPTTDGTGAVPAAQSADGHVRVFTPSINAAIASPLTVIGEVTGGGWFFEASFPVKILDGDGTVIGQSPAKAQGDWMATTSVPFSATIIFTKPKSATGTLLLEKDNPSGLPQNAAELRIPVRFQ